MQNGEGFDSGLGEDVDREGQTFAEEASRPEAVSGGGEAASGEGGGAMGNTPLSTRHLGRISEDTAHISLWVNYGERKAEFFEALDCCYREAQGRIDAYMPGVEQEQQDLDFDPDKFISAEDADTFNSGRDMFTENPDYNLTTDDRAMFSFGGLQWIMSARGIGGKKSDDLDHARAYYRYVIKHGGMVIAFRRESAPTVSNVWIEAGSIPLALNGGLAGMWVDIKGFFAHEKIEIERDILSRVDPYMDTDAAHVGEFCERMEKGHRVKRARSQCSHFDDDDASIYHDGEAYKGFRLGTQIQLRCYDKRREMAKNELKWAVFATLYDGVPDPLTRVEFQLRRKGLRDMYIVGTERIDGVDSYLECREKLWSYLTGEWFRLTEGSVDRKNRHQDRAETWSIWKIVQEAAERTTNEVFRIGRMARVNTDRLCEQAVGCLVKAAVYGEKGHGLNDIIDMLKQFVTEKVGLERLAAIVHQKNLERALRLGNGGAL